MSDHEAEARRIAPCDALQGCYMEAHHIYCSAWKQDRIAAALLSAERRGTGKLAEALRLLRVFRDGTTVTAEDCWAADRLLGVSPAALSPAPEAGTCGTCKGSGEVFADIDYTADYDSKKPCPSCRADRRTP